MKMNHGINKVPIHNKVGHAPVGWLGTVALALQRGIHTEGDHPKRSFRASSEFEFPQPEYEFELVYPDLFKRVREACGIWNLRYVAALELPNPSKKPTLSVISSSEASGKSASFFFLSPDQQFLAKSFEVKDTECLKSILPGYVRHIETEAASLLPRFLGLYRLRMDSQEGKSEVWIGVMPNLFAGIHVISLRYDLKGSTAGRNASSAELKKERPVYKDNDWLHGGHRILLPTEDDRAEFIRLVRIDANFLSSHQLMDYSLLIGVHQKVTGENYCMREANNVITLETEDKIYYVGIVDVLTKYDAKKRAETLISGTLRCRNCSCQPPGKYAKRFSDFITDSVNIHTCAKAGGIWRKRDSGIREAVYVGHRVDEP